MFCTTCGKELDDNAKFCTNCGTPVRPRTAAPETQVRPVAPETPVSPAAPATPVKETAALENTASATQEIYTGKSRMENFRLFSGVMFLVSSVLAFLVFLVRQLGLYNMTGVPSSSVGRALISSLVYFLLFETFASLIPGIASLVLKKPTKTKSIILTIIIGVCMVISWVIEGISVTPGNVSINYNLTSVVDLLLANGLFFCTLMAFISIFQPAALVGEPAPTKAKAWKIVEGVLNIINGIVILLAGIAGFVMMFVSLTGYGDGAFFSIASLFIGLLIPGVWMLVGGILSTRTASGSHRPLSSAYADFMVLVLLIAAISGNVGSLVFGRMSMENAFSGGSDEVAVAAIIIFIIETILIFWYLVCTVISMITAFNKK